MRKHRRTLSRWTTDNLVYLGSSKIPNGPTRVISSALDQLYRTSLGFRTHSFPCWAPENAAHHLTSSVMSHIRWVTSYQIRAEIPRTVSPITVLPREYIVLELHLCSTLPASIAITFTIVTVLCQSIVHLIHHTLVLIVVYGLVPLTQVESYSMHTSRYLMLS